MPLTNEEEHWEEVLKEKDAGANQMLGLRGGKELPPIGGLLVVSREPIPDKDWCPYSVATDDYIVMVNGIREESIMLQSTNVLSGVVEDWYAEDKAHIISFLRKATTEEAQSLGWMYVS